MPELNAQSQSQSDSTKTKKNVFTDTERQQIKEAIGRAESCTSGEIVPVVVHASDTYPGARWRIAVALSFAVAGILLLVFPTLDPFWLLTAQLVSLPLGHLLFNFPKLFRFALSAEEIDEEVQQKGYESFVELNVHSTQDRTGIVILVSLLERQIRVIADTAIYQEAGDTFWNDTVQTLGKRIAAGELAQGLCEAIENCGKLLQEKFPSAENDINELDDVVVEG